MFLRTSAEFFDQVKAVDPWRSPKSGVASVHSIRMVVLLPAPLGPRKPKISPSFTLNDNVIDRCEVPELFSQVLNFYRIIKSVIFSPSCYIG